MKTEIKTGTVCNNNCIFCLNEERKSLKSTEELLREIAHHKAVGFTSIAFTGGETTIRKDFFQLIGYARKLGLEVIIQTNGRALSHGWFVEKLRELKPLYFLISLHAHNACLYRELACADGYDQAVRGMDNLKREGIRFGINVVVNKRNIGYLRDIAEHHSSLGAEMVQLSWARPQGRAKGSDLLISFSEGADRLEHAIKVLIEKGQRFGIIGVPPCILPEYNRHKADPYADVRLVTGGGLKGATELNMERKKKGKGCEGCSLSASCGGIYSGYPEEFFKDLRRM